MVDLELVCFQMISNAGSARSSFIEAINEAKKGNFILAREKIKEGEESYLLAHKVHSSLISKEASGDKTDVSLLLVHAEDQLLNTETTKILAEEIIGLYEVIRK